MSHSLTSLHYHVVFSTKDRRPAIDPTFATALYAYLGGIMRALGAKPLLINGTTDHVHLCFNLRPDTKLTDFMRDLKANSSKWLHEHGHRCSWQTGYSAFTVSTSLLPQVIRYIRNQEKHHRKMTFQQELVLLLERHHITYDSRYIWR